MNFKKAENLFAIAMLVAFFLPWVSFGGFITVAGYNIPKVAEGLGGFAAAFSEEKVSIPIYFYAVYLIPLLSATIIFLDIKGLSTKLVALALGALPTVAFVIVLIKNGGDTFTGMGFGAYLTLLAAIGLILSALGVISLEKKG